MRVVCTVACASKVVIWSCWLGSENKQDKCVELVEGCSQTGVGRGAGLQRIGVEGGGARRPCAATVTCRAWHCNGRAVGGRGKHHLQGLWAWGLDEQDGCRAGVYSSGFIRGKK